jgi:hypothetical protein
MKAAAVHPAPPAPLGIRHAGELDIRNEQGATRMSATHTLVRRTPVKCTIDRRVKG